jgi:hypothetical protein
MSFSIEKQNVFLLVLGQTDISRINYRLKEHRQRIARKAIIQIEKPQYYTPDVYDDMARDAINESPIFVYSVLRYTDNFSLSQRLAIETQTIVESYIYRKYDDRMYNKPTDKYLKVLKVEILPPSGEKFSIKGTHRIDCGGQLRPIRIPTKQSLSNIFIYKYIR